MNRLVRMVLWNWYRLPWLYGKLCHYARNTQRYPQAEQYAHIQKLFRYAIRAGRVELCCSGLENIPDQGGVLFYGNHQGLFDSVAIAATCPRPLGAVYKIELKNTPLIKQIAACTHSYAMDREDVRQSLTVIQEVAERVSQGGVYIIFPEGTRSKLGNEMLEFHAGSFRAALKAKCPVVPVAFVDCFRVLDQKGSQPVKVQVRYLKPIAYEEYQHMKAAQLAQLVKERIRQELEQAQNT